MTKINIGPLKEAIAGDRHALSRAFIWKDSPQGHGYWQSQKEGITPLDIPTLRAMLPTTGIEAGNTYKDQKGREHHCLFVDGNNAYCVGGSGQAAYIWEVDTGKAISLSVNPDYDLHIPVVETRKGSVVFTDGTPDWDSWKEEI